MVRAFLFVAAALTSLGQACAVDDAVSQAGDLGIPTTLDGATPCGAEPVGLWIDRADGYPSRVFVPVESKNAASVFLLDTGSALSFLFLGAGAPDFTPHAGTVSLGCEQLALPGRGYSSGESSHGLAVTGTFGADRLLTGRVELDLKVGTLTSSASTAGSEAWASLGLELVQGHMIASVRADGETLRLLVDTGSQHLLWLGREGKPGDAEVQTTDATGSAVSLFFGSASLEMAGLPPRTVPVFRAPSFPYFEETVRLLGGNIQGLLGLSALGERRLLFDAAAKQVRLGPP